MGRVHITMGMWFGNHGQGCYVTFMAHMLNPLLAGEDKGLGIPLKLVTVQ